MGGVEARLRSWQDDIKLGGERVKHIKELWRMMGDKRYTCPLLALGCVPLTLYNAVFISPSPKWSLAMVGLNVLMLLMAATDDE